MTAGEIRTDLALERRERCPEERTEGVRVSEYGGENCRTTVIEILNETGEKALGKPKGTYVTLEMPGYPDAAALSDDRLEAMISALDGLVPKEGDILVACLGNPDITPDALGPLCASMVFATRQITKEQQKALSLPRLRPVSVIAPSVAGKTGMDSVEIIAGIAEKIKPSAVITVDALAAGRVSRLARTVQIASTGIEPGSGVGNRRRAVNEKTLGVPVIAVGVPTVVDAVSLAFDVLGEEAAGRNIREEYRSMMVTPKDADVITSGAARFIALAINCVLQKNLSREELAALM